MNKKALKLILFVCFSLLIIGVPLYTIFRQEMLLKTGQEFCFKTAPIDPFDAFRGKYVALRLEEGEIMKPPNVNLKPGQKVFAIIEVGSDGFAKISKASLTEPKGSAYLKAYVRYTSGNKLYLHLPIDRYYMDENKAPLAEKLYLRHSSSRDRQDAYVIVALSKGNAVVKKLYVGGKPVEQALQEEMNRAKGERK